MANSTIGIASPPSGVGLVPAFDCSAAIAESLIQAQRVQWEALAAWQGSIAAINQELWDAWACRFAGGVPIDV
jgi:hypothetical protein